MTLPERTWTCIGALVATLAAAIVLALPLTASAGPLNHVDRASATGIHFEDLHPADVIGGQGNDLVIRWRAGRQLTDGTVRITFPGGQWSTPLHPFYGVVSAYMPPGTFSVRPYSDIPADPAIVPPPACETLPASTPQPFDGESAGGAQAIVISHVTCAPGQSLTVLVLGMQAPAASGQSVTHADLPIVASDSVSAARRAVARVRIMPTPRIRLQVQAPPQVEAGVPFLIKISALRPDGGPALHYQGAVALTSTDCTMAPRIDSVAAQFTAADRGTQYVQVVLSLTGTSQAHQLQAYDIVHKAQAGVSNTFDVVGSVPVVQCPVAYH